VDVLGCVWLAMMSRYWNINVSVEMVLHRTSTLTSVLTNSAPVIIIIVIVIIITFIHQYNR